MSLRAHTNLLMVLLGLWLLRLCLERDDGSHYPDGQRRSPVDRAIYRLGRWVEPEPVAPAATPGPRLVPAPMPAAA